MLNPNDPTPRLQVGVIGPTMIDIHQPSNGQPSNGHSSSGRQRALTSACVWLALHPDAAGCQFDRALGMSAQSRTSALSRLRAWLGSDVVPTVRPSGRYRLVAVTDWNRVQQLVCTSSGRLRDQIETADLIASLALVRGEPLADVSAAWADSERIQMSLLLADIAIRVIDQQIQNRPDQAVWALAQGMAAAPEDDRLRQLSRRMHATRLARVA